jgi:hypothetical protein
VGDVNFDVFAAITAIAAGHGLFEALLHNHL